VILVDTPDWGWEDLATDNPIFGIDTENQAAINSDFFLFQYMGF
jgi:hypothetical protein